MKSTPTCGSICAGLGGIDLAFELEGFTTKWYCEVDKNCNQLLAKKFPHAKPYGDLAQFKPNPATDAVDVIFGGTPCQDLSVAGKRTGLDGERSGLFFQMVRICKRLRVGRIVWENVPGAFSTNNGRDFQAVLRAFTGLTVEVPAEGWGNAGFVRTPYTACRWHVAWRVLDAQYFGVPQRRRRIVLVASLGDASCAEILFEPESVCGDTAPGREAGQRVAPTVERRAGSSGQNEFACNDGLIETVGTMNARKSAGGGLGTDFEVGGGLSHALKAQSNCKHRADSETYIPVIKPGNQ